MKVYRRVPGLPRLRRRIILMDGSTTTYMFALKDDSSPEALKAEVSEENLKKMAEVLGVGDQKPNWYRVIFIVMTLYAFPPSIKPSRRRSKVAAIPQGPNPTRAFGYILYYDCLKVWAARFYEELHGVKVSSLPEAEHEEALSSMIGTAVYSIPMKVYRRVPGLPRLRRRIILMEGSTMTYMFVLKDDSSLAALKAKVSEEDLKKMAEVLGVGDQKPNWYRVSV
ncbi:hypothetical protein C8Q80DRAFT_1275028 [Daedaleopsis nitida]|nr:hypothetical protein C8Q80DRAFT_1275028 [Daedaleopsis nitida]